MKYNVTVSIDPFEAHIETICAEFDGSVHHIKIPARLKEVSYNDLIMFFSEHLNKSQYRAFLEHTAIWDSKCVVTLYHDNPTDDGWIEMPHIVLKGDKAQCEDIEILFNEFFNEKISRIEDTVEWAFSTAKGVRSVNMPRKKVERLNQEMYPFIPDVEKFIDNFLTSKENILILTGPPGTGKTTLINHLISRSKGYAQVVYDQDLMMTDDLYINFIEETDHRNKLGVMILEDADCVLSPRSETNNPTMSKLLNVSDGIINSSAIKFVFTANLESTSDIDEALSRPGRCYDVVEFRALTYDEAQSAAGALGIKLSEKREYTIAEIVNGKRQRKKEKPHRLGF